MLLMNGLVFWCAPEWNPVGVVMKKGLLGVKRSFLMLKLARRNLCPVTGTLFADTCWV